MAKLAKINLHQPKASREQYIQSPLFQYSWTCGGKILFVWHEMCFCTKAILAWCFEKLSQAHHCLILGNWARLSPYHTAHNSAVTWCNRENNSYRQVLFVSFSQFNTSLSSSVFPHNRSPLEKEMAKRPRLPPFLSSHLPCLIFQPLTNSGRFSQVARLASSVL